MTRNRLELLRWALIVLTVAAIVGGWAAPKGGWSLLLFFLFLLAGIPAAMLTLHLHPPKFFKFLERPKP